MGDLKPLSSQDLERIRQHARGGLPPGDAEQCVFVLLDEIHRMRSENQKLRREVGTQSADDPLDVSRAVEDARLQAARARESDDLDWTTSKDGRANSSDEFLRLCDVVERIIRDDAHKLLSGRADSTARLIMAQLAHRVGLAPRRAHGPVVR